MFLPFVFFIMILFVFGLAEEVCTEKNEPKTKPISNKDDEDYDIGDCTNPAIFDLSRVDLAFSQSTCGVYISPLEDED